MDVVEKEKYLVKRKIKRTDDWQETNGVLY
jgi:hypothetical protein